MDQIYILRTSADKQASMVEVRLSHLRSSETELHKLAFSVTVAISHASRFGNANLSVRLTEMIGELKRLFLGLQYARRL
jgi:hypothetical protein